MIPPIRENEAMVDRAGALTAEGRALVRALNTLLQGQLASYTVAELAQLTRVAPGTLAYCSNEAGGAVPAFYDGASWRRVTDRAVVS